MDFSGKYKEQPRITEAMRRHLYRKTASFHTPGHKGRALMLKTLGHLPMDLTELPDTGSLYDGGDVIEAAEIEAASAFGADLTLFSAGGCTLCIQTMLLLGVGAGGRVLMARNAHRSAVHAAALLGLEVEWIWPENRQNEGFQQPSVENVERSLRDYPGIRAVYVTSPDYYGNLMDIQALSRVCKDRRIPLLVDNAHGSHLGAFDRHPLALGADMCADSAHKTLPVMTGGAYLHIGEGAAVTRLQAKAAMALFGSTSPSFPVLASLDEARCWWQTEGPAAYRRLAERMNRLRCVAHASGVVRAAFPSWPARLKDPARLTLDGWPGGLSGTALGDYLRTAGCEPEYTDERYAVLIPTPFNTEEELDRLEAAIRALPNHAAPQRDRRTAFAPFLPDERPERVYALREALLRPVETVPLSAAAGRVAARTICPCPPGIAAAVPGERLPASLTQALQRSGFSQVVVLKTL